MATPIITVRNPQLSRWQSALESYLKKTYPDKTIAEIRQLPMVQGAWKHVQAAMKGETIPPPGPTSDAVDAEAYASQQFFDTVKRMPPNLAPTSTMVLASVTTWPYSTAEWEAWGEVAVAYYATEFFIPSKNTYRDVPTNSNGTISNQNYSVINWQLPANAKIIILGDWGTSCLDAEKLLGALLTQCGSTPPDCIIHLGDIYYSGTVDECRDNFYNVIRVNLNYQGPVFTIPGNHEYYNWGQGFFHLIDAMNTNIPITNAGQAASYFCLRSADNNWQFLGLDTGYNDGDPYNTQKIHPHPISKAVPMRTGPGISCSIFPGRPLCLPTTSYLPARPTPCIPIYLGKAM